MPKLVVITAGFSDRAFEITAEKATIGRVDDNRFCIPEPSVSSHHCEVYTKGDDIVVKDLGSTNGSFVNEAQLAADKEVTLRPGQVLRLGQIELRYETGKRQDTAVARPAVKLGEGGAGQTVVMSKNSAFAKKNNNANKIFLAVGAVLVIAIIVFLVIAFSGVSNTGQP